MPIKYVRIPIEILQDRRLSSTQKILLGLIVGFEKKNKVMKMGNKSIGSVLGVNPNYVGELLAYLESLELVRIVNPQSKYRRIYSGKKPIVEQDSTHEENRATHGKNPTYSGKKPRHIGRIGKNKGLRPSAGADTGDGNGDGKHDTTDLATLSATRDATPEDIAFLRSRGIAL